MLNVDGNRLLEKIKQPRPARTGVVLALGLLTAGSLASCGVLRAGIDGSGVAESITYDFDTVDEIEIDNAFNAEITIEEGPPSVEIVIDDNLAQYLEVGAENGKLDVEMESGSYNFNVGPELIVTTPNLDRLDSSGAVSATITGLNTDRFELEASGASSVRIEGNADRVKIGLSGASSLTFEGASDTIELDASGASSADLSRLSASLVELEISGASDAELGEVDTVTGDVSGASRLQIDSDTDASVQTSGASDLDRR